MPPTSSTAVIPAPLTIRTAPERNSHSRSIHIPRRLDSMSPPTPGVDDTPYIRFAIEQLSFDEELVGRGRYSTYVDESAIPRAIPAEQQVSNVPVAPRQSRSSEEPRRPPQPFRFPSSSLDRKRAQGQEVLLPIDRPQGSQWNNLKYVPIPLRLPILALLIFLCVLMIVGIIFSNVHASRSDGLVDYNGNRTGRYFIFQYLPQLLGLVIIVYLFVVQAAIYRSLPYFSMSAELPHDRVLQDMPILPANFILPDIRFFSIGEPLIGLTLLIFWLTNWTIPLLACLYQTQYYVNLDPPHWRWTTVQDLGWFLIALYFLLIAALVYCILRFRSKKSGLMWDPVSLADLIMNFQRSNVLNDFEQSEVSGDIKSQIPPRFLRMGYWTPSNSPEVYYAVGQHNGALNRLSAQDLRPQDTTKQTHSQSSDSFDVERHRYSNDSGFTRDIHSPFIRYRWVPWFLRDSIVLAWSIAAILLVIAFLVVSYVNQAVENGFYPLLPSATQPRGFSPSNFLYSFLPALFGTFLFLIWQPIDTFYRAIQPFANLTSTTGTTAQKSLLQSYNASFPVWVTIQALKNADLKLAYITFVSLMSITLPILSGGVFTAQLFDSGDVRIVASMPGYIALSIFLAIYAFSFLAIWPTRRRYLPHSIHTIAGQLSFLYASPLLSDATLRNVRTKADLVARLCGHVTSIQHMNSNLNEKSSLTGDGRRKIRDRHQGQGNKWVDRQLKYAFGIFIGRDGKEHLGIDRLQRPGSGEMLVVTGTRRSYGGRSR